MLVFDGLSQRFDFSSGDGNDRLLQQRLEDRAAERVAVFVNRSGSQRSLGTRIRALLQRLFKTCSKSPSFCNRPHRRNSLVMILQGMPVGQIIVDERLFAVSDHRLNVTGNFLGFDDPLDRPWVRPLDERSR